MSSLAGKSCSACRKGTPPATADQVAAWLPQLPDWQLIEIDGVQRLQKVFTFKNFAQALQFTNQVGTLAEQENHHPELLTEWGKVTVTWWTHAIGGLHENDFIMAAKTGELL